MINRIVANLVGSFWSRGDTAHIRGDSTQAGSTSYSFSSSAASSSSGNKKERSRGSTVNPSIEQTIADVLIVEIILEYCYKVHRSIRQDRRRQERLFHSGDNISNIRALLVSHHSISKGYTMSAAANPSIEQTSTVVHKASLLAPNGSLVAPIAKVVYCPKCFVKVHGARFASHLEACLKKDTGHVLLSSRLGGKGASDPYPKSSIVRIRLNAKGVPVRHQSRVGVDPGEWEATYSGRGGSS